MKRKVVVQNYGASERTYAITSSFRYPDDAASGAVSVNVPSSIKVPGGKSKDFDVELTIDPSKLNVWTLNGGSRGGDGYRLQSVEFDGYLNIDGGAGQYGPCGVAGASAPRSRRVGRSEERQRSSQDGSGDLKLKNKSDVLAGRVDVFSLTGQSDSIKKKLLPQPGDNFAVVDLKSVGVRLVDIGGGRVLRRPVRHRHVRRPRAPELPGRVRHLHRCEQRRHAETM